jgi:hypothetical protein
MNIKVIAGVVLAVAGWIVMGYLASSRGNPWTPARSGLVAAGLILLASGASSLLFKRRVRVPDRPS